MIVRYGEYKDFLRDLYEFINPQPKLNNDDVDEVREYLEENVKVEVPEALYLAANEYKHAGDKLQSVLCDILNSSLKTKREETKKKKTRS